MSSLKILLRGLPGLGAAVLFCSQALAQRPLGIDVSHWQGTGINWTSVKNSGRTFAWAKASEGTGFTDSAFAVNAANAKTAGVLIGAYHYARYDNNLGTAGAADEAAHFWSVAKNYIKGSGTYLMPMLDVEQTPGASYNKTTLSQWVNAWCSNVVYSASLSNVTVKPVIYTSSSFGATWLDSTVASQWTPWIANWRTNDPQTYNLSTSQTSPWSTWTVWQFSATGSVPGVSGNCDEDVFNGTSNSLATLVIGGLGPPFFLSQPSNRHGDQGGSITMTASAGGAAPLKYQWRFNGANISSATNSALSLTSIQTGDAGSYTVVVTNSSGSITSGVATLTVNPLFSTVFSDNFDANSSANWTVNKSTNDTRVTFNYDYSSNGIPSAPNSVGNTTRGVKFEANMTNGVTAALNISPIGQTFSGNYRLHFDMWINANGPFPAGGTGSTEHLTAGVGTAGNRVQWNSGTADGFWFAIDGEGQATDTSATLPDVRAYSGITLQAANSGVYDGGPESNIRGNGHPYYSNVFPGGQTAPALQQSNYAQQTGSLDVGCVGFAWRDVVVNKTNNTVEWFIDGLKICRITNATFTASNIFVGYWDSFTSISDNTNLSFGLVDNVRVEVQAGAPTISSQPQNQIVTQGSNATFTVIASGAPTPGYQWRFNGTSIASATTSSYTKTSAQTSDAGSYTVVVTNTSGSITSSVATLTVNVPPSISGQPQSLTVNQTSNAAFSVTASGSPSPGYQWRFNGANISGATASSYTRSNAQPGDAGSYTVAVTNVAGAVTSVVAVLTVNGAPYITAQPQDKTGKIGGSATFNVSAGGTAPFSYQWQFNGADIAGATTNSYTLTNLQTNDAGSYSVTVTNVAGSITSSNAMLTVVPPQPPRFELISQLPGGSAHLFLSGEIDSVYEIHGSTNLLDWSPLGTVTNTSDMSEFIDSSASTVSSRYYRAKSVP